MKILAIGDIVGSVGCEHLRRVLPQFKREQDIDLVIANGENSADRNGISPSSAEHILPAGWMSSPPAITSSAAAISTTCWMKTRFLSALPTILTQRPAVACALWTRDMFGSASSTLVGVVYLDS